MARPILMIEDVGIDFDGGDDVPVGRLPDLDVAAEQGFAAVAGTASMMTGSLLQVSRPGRSKVPSAKLGVLVMVFSFA